ncbi:MAG: efflux RND transporter periplasmic adaptor subunit [Xanthomonadales bacterium]|nr:efflux RND transporter periplasmic adaptor subunit [Xanthomonadales bacterium]
MAQWLLVLALLVAGLMALRWAIEPGVDRSDVRIATVERGTVVASISATGQVVPGDEQIISSLFVSEVTEVVARAGDTVTAGDLLLRLDARALKSTIRDLNEQLALKDNQRHSAQLALERSLNEAQGRRDLLEIDLLSRKARHQRLSTLADKGAISAGDLQEAELDVRRTQAELKQLSRSIDNQQATAEADLERISLEASILSNQLREQQRTLDSAEVRAPRDGVVTWVLDQPGAPVTSGLQLARVADLSRYRVEAQVSDFYAPRLRQGLQAKVTAGNRMLSAEVDAILPTVEGGSMTLLIELDDPAAEGLRPQLRVDVEVVTGRAENALSIVNGPAIGEGGRQFVYRINNGEAVRTQVDLGVASRNSVQILDGLAEGDQVIISDMRDYQHLEIINLE